MNENSCHWTGVCRLETGILEKGQNEWVDWFNMWHKIIIFSVMVTGKLIKKDLAVSWLGRHDWLIRNYVELTCIKTDFCDVLSSGNHIVNN